jgi:hypothetical protein
MKKEWINIIYLLFSGWFLFAGCKERFEPDLPVMATGYLVVEGVINTGPGETKIKLSRSLQLGAEKGAAAPELKAQLQVEGSDETMYPLTEKGEGVYVTGGLNLAAAVQYRLRITTAAGKDYLSDFTAVKKTPPIDSINWRREANGLQLYVNAHDPQNNTRYYQWDYEETWEYLSAADAGYKWENGMVVERAPDEHTYRCWGQAGATSLLLGSSAKLSQDIIYLSPLVFIPPASIKLSHRYSILVRQYALSRQAYEFLQMMKKNTETTGSFFDPQPSALKGNIRCLSNPDEPVIGYISACDVIEKRIFIAGSEIDNWGYQVLCKSYLVVNHPDSMVWYFEGKANPYPRFFEASTGQRLPQTPHCCPPMTLEQRIENKDNTPSGTCCVYIPISKSTSGWQALSDICADCTLRGGKTIKPDFWP